MGGRASTSFRWLSAAATFLATLQAGMAALGAAHVPLGQPAAIGLGILAAMVALLVARALGPGHSGVLRVRLSRGRWLLALLLLFTATLYAASFVAAWCKPDLSWDGEAYHTPMIATWARVGYVHWAQPDAGIGRFWEGYLATQCNGFARGAELMGFFLLRALGTSRAVNTFNFWFLPLGALGLVVLARALGASRPLALFAASAFLLVPVNIAQSMTTYVDTAYACCAIAWLAAVATASSAMLRGGLDGRHLPALGCSLGLVIATKAAGPLLVAAGLVALLAAAVAGWSGGRGQLRSALVVGCAIALGAAIGGQWYLRNWIHEGNPFHPVRVSALGVTLFPGVAPHEILAEDENLPDSMRHLGAAARVLLAWTQGWFWRWPKSIRWYDAREGGLGYLWLFACVPATFVFASRALGGRVPRSARWVFGAVACTTVAVFLATPMSWWARYTLWIYALGLPCLAACLTAGLHARSKVLRAVTAALAFGCGAVVVTEAIIAFLWSATPANFIASPRIPATPGELAHGLTDYERTTFFFPGLDGPVATEAFTSDATFAVAPVEVPALPVLGQLAMPVGFRRVWLVDANIGHDDEALRALRERTGVAYVVWSLKLGRPEALERVALRVERLHPLWDLYELVGPEPGRRHALAK
jgi:hypothetical protein